jgi:hypothetical protein
MALWTETAGGVRLRVRVQPRASRSGVAGVYGEALKVRVTAPPVAGAANAAVVAVIARWLGIPPRTVTVEQGHAARDKVIAIAGPDLGARIEQALARG